MAKQRTDAADPQAENQADGGGMDQTTAQPQKPADHADFLRRNAENAPAQPETPAARLGLPAAERAAARRPSSRRKDDGSDRPGGAFIRGATFDEDAGKHYGGHIADSEGRVLATFEDDRENTGNIDDGTQTEDGKKPFEERSRVGR